MQVFSIVGFVNFDTVFVKYESRKKNIYFMYNK